ncbi:MAG TPA: hypothetical protein G4O00_14420 [Thermoflexia bacterium]|jgi:hypothetical protein|nr:hypothetical protein [Thermoflexia bacterium]
MSQREPLFAGLIFNEEGEPVQTTEVGGEPFYAIPDGDFLRHIEAVEVDRQVVAHIKERLLEMKDLVVEGVMRMVGSDDPFTRAAIEKNLENFDQVLEASAGMVNLEDFRLWLWMTGFRVVVNVHGEVVRVEMPGLEPPP